MYVEEEKGESGQEMRSCLHFHSLPQRHSTHSTPTYCSHYQLNLLQYIILFFRVYSIKSVFI